MLKLSDLASFDKGKVFPTIPLGEYLCTLDIKPGRRKKYKSEDEEDCLRFVFTTVDVVWEDEETGKEYPYKLTKSSGVKYGNDKATLTILIDQMIGGHMDEEQYAEFDLAELIGKRWLVKVDERTDERGKLYNEIIGVRKPAKPGGAKAKVKKVEEAEEESPFGADIDPYA